MQITSAKNHRVKYAAGLRNSRTRAENEHIIIDGIREIHRALEGAIEIWEVFVCDELATSRAALDLVEEFSDSDTQLFHVTPAVYEKLAYGDRAEGIVAVATMPSPKLADFSLPASNRGRPPLVAVLEGMEKPGNIGAVLRSADGAGVSAVIVADGGAELYKPNAIRASLGTIFTQKVFAATTDETLAWLRQNKLAIYAARVDGVVDYTACDLTKPCAIVLGGEAKGLSDRWRADDITAIRLPMLGAADSLNVSATAAVLCYEALRQRTR
jgi:TrmH family RNA methyltransferase